MPHGAGAQEGVKARNRQLCYSLSRAFEKADSKRPRTESKASQPEPAPREGATEQSMGRGAIFARLGFLQAALEADKATPSLSALKRQKTAVKVGKERGTVSGQPPDTSMKGKSQPSMERPQQPGSARLGKLEVHAKSSRHSEDHTGPSSSTEGPPTVPAREVPQSGSGKLGQKSGESISQEDAARLVNAALDSHPGLSPSSAPSKLNKQPAGNGISAKKLKKKHRQSLPSGKPVAADVPQRATKSAQKQMSAGEGGSPVHGKPLVGQGNGTASAGRALTDSQRKKARCMHAARLAGSQTVFAQKPHPLSPKSAALQGIIMAEPERTCWMLRR